MAKDTQWVLCPIVHVVGFPKGVWQQVSEVDITFDWLKTKFMLKHGLKEDDFIYYYSRKQADEPGAFKLVDVTNDNVIQQMLEEWKWRKVIELHLYRKPSWYVEWVETM